MISFDTAPTIYWFLCFVLASLVIAEAFFRKTSNTIFILLALLLFVVSRLPVVMFNRELNPDESQMISHAITLLQDPIYWRSVDGTTIGPLDNYFITIPGIFGFALDYTSIRIMGMIANILSFIFLFLSLRNWLNPLTTRIVWLLPVLFLAFTQEVDFVHYSSEQVPLLLLAICIWYFSKISISSDIKGSETFLLGLFAGMVPFAKLQVVPSAIILGISATWFSVIFFKKYKIIKPLLLLILGAVLFPALVFIWAFFFGVFGDMVDFYLLGNVIYANSNDKSIIAQLLSIIAFSPDFKALLAIISIPILVFVISIFIKSKVKVNIKVTGILFLVASIYGVTKSGNDFVHYLNLLIFPAIILAGIGLQKIKAYAVLFPIALLGWFGYNDAVGYLTKHQMNQFDSVNARSLHESAVITALKKYSKEKDYMVVWGWQCAYYVEAQLAQGTAENHSERSIFDHKMRRTYRDRYIKDINRTKPAIILDAVGRNSHWVQDTATQGINSFPELSLFVKENYADLGLFDGTRLYVRKDRIALSQ